MKIFGRICVVTALLGLLIIWISGDNSDRATFITLLDSLLLLGGGILVTFYNPAR
jgi:hypothetical protein